MNKSLKSKILRSSSGISVAEMIVAVAISVLLFGGISAASQTAEKYWRSNKIQMEVHRELQLAMKRMSSELRQAGPSSIIDVAANDWPSPMITFKVVTDVTGSITQWSANEIRYFLTGSNGDVLQRQQNGMSNQVLANNIKSITFTRMIAAPNIVEVAMVAEKDTIYGRTVTESMDFSVKLRN